MLNEVKHNSGAGVMIGIPTLGRPVPLQWALNFKSLSPPINFNTEFNLIYGREIGYARNQLARAAIERNCKYLFFLGDDTVPPPFALRQLIYRMENHSGVDVVGGVYVSKSDPPAPLVFKGNGAGSYWDWKIGEFFECTGLGMDCTLIRTDLFSRIKEPWFETIYTDKYLDGIPSCEEYTEDLWFLKKAREEAGAGIFCDGSVICEHHDVYANKVYTLPKDSLPMRQLKVNKDKRCLMLGPRIQIDESFDVVLCTQENDPAADYRLRFDNLPFDAEEFDFICVTEQILDIEHFLPEFRRVAKSNAKIAINLNPKLNESYFTAKLGAVMNGSFIEFENK